MRKSRSKTRWNLIVIVVVACVLTYAGFKYLAPQAEPAPIFLITPTVVEYGDTTITGTLRKDVPIGEEGNYLLVLDDSRPVLLDVQAIDNLLDLNVSVSGTLSPAPNSSSPMSMVVQKIAVIAE